VEIKTCKTTAAPLSSMFLKSSYCTVLVRLCSISSHILADYLYSFLQTCVWKVNLKVETTTSYTGNAFLKICHLVFLPLSSSTLSDPIVHFLILTASNFGVRWSLFTTRLDMLQLISWFFCHADLYFYARFSRLVRLLELLHKRPAKEMERFYFRPIHFSNS